MARRQKTDNSARVKSETELAGVIVSHFGVAVLVRYADGSEARVKVRRNSAHVVGDRVEVYGEVVQRLPRANVLERRDPFNKVRTLAANLDLLAIVVAPQPRTPRGFIERAIVAARAAPMKVVVIVNKCDIAGGNELACQLREEFSDLEQVFAVSARSGEGIEPLHQHLSSVGRAIFIGVSGAGKSSLLNTLVPGTQLETGSLNADDHGCHTTSVSTLIDLPGGGQLVDTPGFRDFAPVTVSSEQLAMWFPGFEPLFAHQQCRFRNCRHRNEPGCALKQAVEQQSFAASRYQLYLETLDNIEALEQEEGARRKPF